MGRHLQLCALPLDLRADPLGGRAGGPRRQPQSSLDRTLSLVAEPQHLSRIISRVRSQVRVKPETESKHAVPAALMSESLQRGVGEDRAALLRIEGPELAETGLVPGVRRIERALGRQSGERAQPGFLLLRAGNGGQAKPDFRSVLDRWISDEAQHLGCEARRKPAMAQEVAACLVSERTGRDKAKAHWNQCGSTMREQIEDGLNHQGIRLLRFTFPIPGLDELVLILQIQREQLIGSNIRKRALHHAGRQAVEDREQNRNEISFLLLL